MAPNITIGAFTKFSSELPQKLTIPLTLLSDFSRKVVLNLFHSMTAITNSVAIFIVYLYLKNFRHHSLILVDGYVSIFKVFAEYIGATACVCYGLLEMNFNYMILGVIGILMGLALKALLLYHQKLRHDRCTAFVTRCASIIYLVTIFSCCTVFHDITVKMGALRCASRIVTCVVPLVALSDTFRISGCTFCSLSTDALAISALWWYCSHLSVKYFVVVPSVVGAIFTFIRYILEEIQNAAAKVNEEDLYDKR